VTPLGWEERLAHAPDEHWWAVAGDDSLAGRCSLWWGRVPHLDGERPGLIGHFAARDGEAACLLLSHACRRLAESGCSVAVGPMDGTTWRRYRFVTTRGSEPPFFLEPDNPQEYPTWFEAAGFAPLARYYSNLDPDLGWGVPAALRGRLERNGITIRPLDPDDFDGELGRIHVISVASFRDNFLYSPISRDEFIALYTRIRPVVQPELVLFAECAGEPVGFIFAVGDQLNRRPDGSVETVIIKSLAVLPAWNGKGIGALLMAEVTAAARALGYRRGIHALMHEDNRSRSLSGHHGTVMREYTLYSRRL
jgi:predicted N-acetyltransferase YhbS